MKEIDHVVEDNNYYRRCVYYIKRGEEKDRERGRTEQERERERGSL